jgi:hypothetical protein
LSLLGCDLPKTLMGAAAANETGHWESQAIADFNDALLDSAGSNWHDWLAFNPGWYRSPKAEEFKERALEVLGQEFGTSRLFVLKDPRICRILPLWLDVFSAAGVKPAIVMPLRNPLEVAASLERRDGFDPGLGHLLWLRHVLEAEAASRGLKRFHCSYDTLMTSWSHFVSSAQETLDVAFPRPPNRVEEEIGAFLSEKLRHHREAPKSTVANLMLSTWLRSAFEIFDRWTEDGESTADFSTLDRIRAEFDAAAPAFARLVASGQSAARRARQLFAEKEEALSRFSAELLQRDARIADLEGALAEAQRLAAERDALAHAANTAEQALAATRMEFARTECELLQRRHEVEESAAELAMTRGSLSRLEVKLDERDARIADLETVLAEARRLVGERDALAHAASAAEQALAATRVSLSQTEEGLKERFEEIAKLMRSLHDEESSARRAADEVDWLRETALVLLRGEKGWRGRLNSLLPGGFGRESLMRRLKHKGLFDAEIYLREHPDVALAGIDPLHHYIDHGMRERRSLGPGGRNRNGGSI